MKGKILENDPPRRLSYSFLPQHDQFFSETHASRVVLDIEPQKDQVKLTVTHDDFAEDSKVFAAHQQWLAARAVQPQELP